MLEVTAQIAEIPVVFGFGERHFLKKYIKSCVQSKSNRLPALERQIERIFH